ncbi:MAG: hypothetical protein UU48_C0009G0008 [Candidatus Uhrbacteria bacterium GW2011_GWF2_41_16]|uniref:Uncharacterized protein n=2 Tax=Candidatus Uhriibacteriota TaxID=1752732 RepID=A0A0G0VDL3_9BACT|nr:MAG: hypothetical protein UU35_C0011G0006 [Candidatus Uhrbacteria bacterium GW2011_GWC2_41_11]KKR97736.1 MAG: hypothetical protein UU48_C0009G0008 [Candidatus Uhrbacteria bacterium GW2011_GWF2_41_16]
MRELRLGTFFKVINNEKSAYKNAREEMMARRNGNNNVRDAAENTAHELVQETVRKVAGRVISSVPQLLGVIKELPPEVLFLTGSSLEGVLRLPKESFSNPLMETLWNIVISAASGIGHGAADASEAAKLKRDAMQGAVATVKTDSTTTPIPPGTRPKPFDLFCVFGAGGHERMIHLASIDGAGKNRPDCSVIDGAISFWRETHRPSGGGKDQPRVNSSDPPVTYLTFEDTLLRRGYKLCPHCIGELLEASEEELERLRGKEKPEEEKKSETLGQQLTESERYILIQVGILIQNPPPGSGYRPNANQRQVMEAVETADVTMLKVALTTGLDNSGRATMDTVRAVLYVVDKHGKGNRTTQSQIESLTDEVVDRVKDGRIVESIKNVELPEWVTTSLKWLVYVFLAGVAGWILGGWLFGSTLITLITMAIIVAPTLVFVLVEKAGNILMDILSGLTTKVGIKIDPLYGPWLREIGWDLCVFVLVTGSMLGVLNLFDAGFLSRIILGFFSCLLVAKSFHGRRNNLKDRMAITADRNYTAISVFGTIYLILAVTVGFFTFSSSDYQSLGSSKEVVKQTDGSLVVKNGKPAVRRVIETPNGLSLPEIHVPSDVFGMRGASKVKYFKSTGEVCTPNGIEPNLPGFSLKSKRVKVGSKTCRIYQFTPSITSRILCSRSMRVIGLRGWYVESYLGDSETDSKEKDQDKVSSSESDQESLFSGLKNLGWKFLLIPLFTSSLIVFMSIQGMSRGRRTIRDIAFWVMFGTVVLALYFGWTGYIWPMLKAWHAAG